MKRYVGLAHRTPSGWSLSFPDFPGCVTGAPDFETTLLGAAEVLRLHVGGMIDDGEDIPAPQPVEALREREDLAELFDGAVVAMVPLLPMKGAAVRLNITMDRELVAEIDRQTGNRSAWLAEAARLKLAG